MKKLLLLTFYSLALQYTFGQSANYWQQKVDYSIQVTLNDVEKTLDGNIQIQYSNNSPDSLSFIWMHLWPNAYKNDKTAFSDQLLENGNTDFYFAPEEKHGYINRLAFKVDNISAEIEDHPVHQDIIRLLLPAPLAPGKSISIQTAFHVKLPYNFSRGGYVGNSFMGTQWYPKPAVYDKKGWHEMPYLDQGEFYSEFGNFDVDLTVPKAYKVAATGTLKNETDNGQAKTMHYQQNNIHDFAWFADKDFIVKHDTLQLATKLINVYAYYKEKDAEKWQNSIAFIKSAIRTKSNWLGEYPYDIVTAVDNSGNNTGGGMEYPTITLIETPGSAKELDNIINHEVGHNWFYGILATNERDHPWMDEGMNSYYDRRYLEQQYGSVNPAVENKSSFVQKRMPENFEHAILETITGIKKDQPIETVSGNFSEVNYDVIAYTKTSEWMKLLEEDLGTSLFDRCMKAYYEEWKFKHPYPEDFKKVVEQTSGKNLDAVFALLYTKGSLQKPVKKDLRFVSFFSLKDADKHNYIAVTPAIGYNAYDKFMVGITLHNYSLPLSRLTFIVAPLYATGSKQINGIGNISYSTYSEKKISKIVVGVNGERFSTRQSLDTTGGKIFENFYKIVPSVQLYFKHPPRSHMLSWVDLRSYIIGEQKFDFNYIVSVPNADSTEYIPYQNATKRSTRYINQLSFNLENSRVLYPYDFQLQLQQGKGFYRVNLNADYFFNYVKGGGMQVRFFAAKFGYLGEKDFTTYLYRPKLLAATGDDDYTYSNYFVGRTASTSNAEVPVKNLGIGAQQVMIRDGGLKFRIDQFDFLQGRSENWVTALNFNTTIPDIFPVKLPIKLFFDVGTYAEAWEKNAATSRFLYVGGLQLSLFKNILNVYAPLLYSKDFKNTLESMPEQNTFLKKLTFSIDVQNIRLKKFFPQLNL